MDTTLPQKIPFILDRNLAKANCTGNCVCTSCDTVVLGLRILSKDFSGDRQEWRQKNWNGILPTISIVLNVGKNSEG